MKKIVLFIFSLVIGLSFIACEDPYANQTIAKPTSYAQETLQDTTGFVAVLKTGVNPVTVLSTNLNDSLSLITCTSIPTLVDSTSKMVYKLQISGTPDFSTYSNMPFTFSGKAGDNFKISYKIFNDTIFAINSNNGSRDVYAKVLAYISNGGLKSLFKTVVLKFQASPLPMKAFTSVTPRVWYIVGLGGHWDNSVNGLGSSLIPLSVVSGLNYNDAGDGKYTYTGYFNSTDGFKLLRNIGDWNNDLWGMTGSAYIHNGGGNISVPTSGYYTITLNSMTNVLTIVPSSVSPTTYSSMGLIGAMTGWGSDIALTPNTSTNNHIWYTTYTFASDSQCKFRAQSDWGINWGTPSTSDGDPLYSKCGIGVANGKNLIETAGTYTIIFNDIDGTYYFK